MTKVILVTGAAGFIGSCFTLKAIEAGYRVVALDSLSYAGDLDNLEEILAHPNFNFVQGGIEDQELVSAILKEHNIDWVVNFAAESHVDNSISGPEVFVTTNVLGTYHLLWSSLQYWQDNNKDPDFRFLHVSTDEVYGELELTSDEKFTENTSYAPNSPYSASKAASDHLVRAWHVTYGLPVLTTNCSNNYGPRQHQEKLIPTMIRSCLEGKALPVYGDGKNVRDWIYVEDHCDGILQTLKTGKLCETYCFGGNAERNNLYIVNKICEILDELEPRGDGQSYKEQITFVEDRLGHDRRYAIDCSKAEQELGFTPSPDFDEKLKETVKWYCDVYKKFETRAA